MVISQLLDYEPSGTRTDLRFALEYMTSAIKKRSTMFLVSDFVDSADYYKALSVANHRHDVIAVQVYDKRETQMPNVGLVRVTDAERGVQRWVDTASRRVRQTHDRWWYDRQQQMHDTLHRCGVDLAEVATDEDYVKALMALFRNRG